MSRYCIGLILMFAGAALAAPSSIALEGEPPVVRVRSAAIVGGAAMDARAALRVSIDRDDAPALAGSYNVESGILTFTPRYPLQPGLAYRADFRLGSEHLTQKLTLQPPAAADRVSTTVERVYPSTTEWPENQLKFYVHFSAPMSRGEAFSRIHLLDRSKGDAEIKLPFLEIDQELWDRDQKRLTILFDPGRVKRGLVPHLEAGPPLVAGGRYLLVIDGEWKDARNNSLAAPYRKEFTVVPAWRDGIDIRKWKLETPRAGTREPLRITFSKPLDYALLMRCIMVEGLEGEASVEKGETQWVFTPAQPWTAKPHAVSVLEILEDLAGNKVGRPFDVDRFERVDRSVATGNVKLDFTPKP